MADEKSTLQSFLHAQRAAGPGALARHAGHLDVVRELLDGRTGLGR